MSRSSAGSIARAHRHAVRFALPGSDATLCELTAGEWSENLELSFSVGDATVDGVFRLKLQVLDPTAGLFRLYVTDICRQSWLEQPVGAVGDTAASPACPHPASAGIRWGWAASTSRRSAS